MLIIIIRDVVLSILLFVNGTLRNYVLQHCFAVMGYIFKYNMVQTPDIVFGRVINMACIFFFMIEKEQHLKMKLDTVEQALEQKQGGMKNLKEKGNVSGNNLPYNDLSCQLVQIFLLYFR